MRPAISDISIVYCRPCGYEKRAREAAAALKSQCKLTAELVPAAGGIFEVKVGGSIVARRAKGHFPTREEVVAAVAAAVRRDPIKSMKGRARRPLPRFTR